MLYFIQLPGQQSVKEALAIIDKTRKQSMDEFLSGFFQWVLAKAVNIQNVEIRCNADFINVMVALNQLRVNQAPSFLFDVVGNTLLEPTVKGSISTCPPCVATGACLLVVPPSFNH